MTVAPLTLASSSPRRRQLLEMLGIPVRVVPSNVLEVRRPLETPASVSPGRRRSAFLARWSWEPIPR